MRTSYHTHTFRCNHASGTEEEYVLRAIEAGVSKLGFSDHAPYPMEPGYCSGFRMKMTDTPGYVQTLLDLREKYRGKIEIYIGFEAEYYPKYFKGFLEFLDDFPYDYLLMGQHLLGNEIDEGARGSGAETDDEAVLKRYVDQVCEGLETGAFSCVAHPDIIHYIGPEDIYQKHMAVLCACAKRLSVPLEINGLGIRTNRFYPDKRLWPVMAQTGNDVVYGCDAHDVQNAWDEESYQKTLKIAEQYGLHLIDDLPLRRPVCPGKKG